MLVLKQHEKESFFEGIPFSVGFEAKPKEPFF